MEKLGLIDQVFYKADQYGVERVIMSGLAIFKPARRTEPLDPVAIAGHLAARLAKMPLVRTRFVQDPLRLGDVFKVEDPDFDVRRHIAVTTLASPGSHAQLVEKACAILEQPLTLSHLWDYTVIGGLEGGRVALVSRMHHAVADGVGASEAMASMYDRQPVAPEQPADDSVRSTAGVPSSLSLVGNALRDSVSRLFVRTPRFIATRTVPLLGALADSVRAQLVSDATSASIVGRREFQPTSLNIGGQSGRRAIAFKTLPRKQVRDLAAHFHCKVNDIGLLLYACALEHYLQAMGERVDFDLICGLPLSLRGAGSPAGGNQVTVGVVSLHNTLVGVADRLEAIASDMSEVKRRLRPDQPPPVELGEIGDLVPPLTLDAMLLLAGRFDLFAAMVEKFPVFNALFSNVPGPSEPTFVANAELAEIIPLIPLMSGVAVTGGITSTADTVTLGFHCDGEAVRNESLFTEGVERGFEALRAAARPKQRRGKPKTGVRRKTTARR